MGAASPAAPPIHYAKPWSIFGSPRATTYSCTRSWCCES